MYGSTLGKFKGKELWNMTVLEHTTYVLYMHVFYVHAHACAAKGLDTAVDSKILRLPTSRTDKFCHPWVVYSYYVNGMPHIRAYMSAFHSASGKKDYQMVVCH